MQQINILLITISVEFCKSHT